MFLSAIVVAVLCVAGADLEPSYLARTASLLERVNADVPAMVAAAQPAADRLVRGGRLWAAGDPAFISELTGRAGGLMMIAGLGDAAPAPGDVVLYGPAPGAITPESIATSGAYVVAFADVPIAGASKTFDSYAEESHVSPTLAAIAPAWAFCGALVGACLERGKMPVTFETIGLPGGYPRIQQYQAQGIHFLDRVPAEGERFRDLGTQFCAKTIAILRRVESEERKKLERAGAWARETRSSGKTVYMYSMGHFVPAEIARSEMGKAFKTAEWYSGFTAMKKPEDPLNTGDLVFHIGYQHPPADLLARAKAAGARVLYVDLYEHRDYRNDPNVIWVDPMWPWDDAVVEVPGYDIPLLPPSGIVNSAIAWEIWRLTQLNGS